MNQCTICGILQNNPISTIYCRGCHPVNAAVAYTPNYGFDGEEELEDEVVTKEDETPKGPVIKLWPVSVDQMLDFEGIYSIRVAGGADTGLYKHVEFKWTDGRQVDILFENLLPSFVEWLRQQGLTR